MPSLEPGTYTIQMVFNTKSPLGTLTSSRQFVIEDPLYDKLSVAYAEALRKGSTSEAAKASRQALDKWFKRVVRPGQAVTLSKLNVGDPLPSPHASATVRWYPGPASVQILADVVDSGFSTEAPKGAPWEAASLEVFLCPSGMSQEINQFIISPNGADGKATVMAQQTDKDYAVKAAWKRTAKGYTLDVRIPWSILKGYKKGWSVMPVEASVNFKTPQGRSQLVMTRPGRPDQTARTYSVLKAK